MNRTRKITSTIAALLAVIVLVFVSASEPVEAGTQDTSLNVAVAVTVRCSITAGSLNFGSNYVYGQAADLDGATTVVVNCDAGRKVAVKLGQGLYPAPGSTDNNPRRRMQNAGTYLNYNLYEDAARTLVWDNRSNAVKTTRVFPYTATVYGRIPGLQSVVPGVYSDTVVATVYY